jgi:uncharacterized membrane protein YphA (DoxX/SURF4 family)
MNVIRNFSRLIIAPIFIFSGFVKAIDPLGSAYKFSDYFEAFGMDFLMPLSMFMAVLLSTAELVIGLSLIMPVVMRVTSWALLIFMSFFTVLTLIIAITNPVTDCGCFGDAIILTNWQTFWKNVIFMIPTLIVFYGRKRFRPIASMAAEWSIVALLTVMAVLLSVYNYRNLPVFDFRPYKIATHIPTGMSTPEGAPMDEYETTLVYAKDGIEKEFLPQDVPYQDTNWKWVETRNTLISKGYEPPIHDFSITTYDGWDITDSVLYNQEFSFLVISYEIENADEEGLKRVNKIANTLKAGGVLTYGMTASTSSQLNEVTNMLDLSIDFHTTDEITLKTIIRSNPGLILLKDGLVIDKWHYNNLPDPSDFVQGIQAVSLKHQGVIKNKTTVGFYLLLLMAVLSFLGLLVKVGE